MEACSYAGNSDIYGLGIRLGIYLQWAAGILSKMFLDEEAIRDVLNENGIFLLAIFLATILLVTDAISGVHRVDILIMLHIFFGNFYTIFYDIWLEERMDYLSSLLGIVFKLGTAIGMAVVGIWFWFYDVASPPHDVDCSAYAFLFGRVGLSGINTVMAFKAFSVINIVVCGLVLSAAITLRLFVLCYTLIIISPALRKKSDIEASPQGGTTSNSGQPPQQKSQLTFLQIVKLACVPAIRDEGFMGMQQRMEEDLGLRALQRLPWMDKKLKQDGLPALLTSILDDSIDMNTILQSFAPEDRTGLQSLLISLLLKLLNGGAIRSANSLEEPATPAGKNITVLNQYQVFTQWFNTSPYQILATSGTIFIYSIISIELLLRYNAITEVYTLLSTSQIIPFTIGSASLWKVVWKIILLQMEKSVRSELNPATVVTVGNVHGIVRKNYTTGYECPGTRNGMGEDGTLSNINLRISRAATM